MGCAHAWCQSDASKRTSDVVYYRGRNFGGGGREDLVEVSYGVHRVSLMDSTRFYSISYMADDPEDVSY